MWWVGAAISVAGTALTYSGQRRAAKAAEKAADRRQHAANIEASHMEQQAEQSVASSQRQMLAERKQARLLESRALAVSAASGAGASDTTVMNVISRIAAEGSYRSAIAYFEGQDRARQLRIGATVRREGGDLQAQYGRAEAKGMETSALGSLFAGGATLYSRYAGSSNPPPPSSGGGSDASYLDAGSQPMGNYG